MPHGWKLTQTSKRGRPPQQGFAVSTNTSLKNYVPTRQVSKPDLVRLARALGLIANEKEESRTLVERCVNAAERLHRDLELSQRRPR